MKLLPLLLLALVPGLSLLQAQETPRLNLKPGDHICLIGNSLAAGMSLPGHNHFEALLHQRFPKHNLVVRNLAWPADEVALRPRTDGFGTPDEHLTFSKADVVLAFYGFNESFKGAAEVESFQADLEAWIVHTQQQNYSGKGAPRIVLVGPATAEDIQDPLLPDTEKLNASLKLYSQAMQTVAKKRKVPFVDLFAMTNDLMSVSEGLPRTSNTVHLNQNGDRMVGRILNIALFSKSGGTKDEIAKKMIDDDELPEGVTKPRSPMEMREEYEALTAALEDKNFHWYHRYRIVDSYYVYGGRADLKFADGDQTNRDVLQREREVLDVKVANRDRRIWDIVQGRKVPEKVDDSNVPPFLDVKTFFGTGKKKDAGQNTGMTSKTAEPDEIKFLNAKESKKHFKLAPGYAIDLFAGEDKFPDLGNAVAFAFDTRGRLWVSTFQSYPQWKPGGEMNDKIIILEDTDHDGKADYQQTFAEGLHMPISFQFHNGGVLVSQQRELLFLKDLDNDDKADIKEQVLDGFDSADSHHVINSFTYGPGGDLWFQEGTFQHSQVETPWGPVRCVDAGTYRYEPRTKRLEVGVSYKYANPHGIAFDKWGQLFISDASGGANYFGTAFSGYLPYPEKHSTMQQWFPKRVRPTSGCEFVSSRHFPDEAQGRFLLNNCIGVQGVLQHEVKAVGSGFEGKEIEPLLLSDDPLFRPVAMTFAPDGSLYIIDWAEALIGHMQYSIRDPLRDSKHGRIWRITYPGRPLVEDPKIVGEKVYALIPKLLTTPELRTKERIRQELGTRPWEEISKEIEGCSELKPISSASLSDSLPGKVNHSTVLLELLWLHQSHHVLPPELHDKLGLLRSALRCDEPMARAAATKVLCAWRDRIRDSLALLMIQAKDEHPLVRLEAVRAASWYAADTFGQPSPPATMAWASEVALEVLNQPMDYYLDYTLGETMRVLDVDVKSLKNPKAIAYVVNRLTNDELATAPEVEPIWQARVERKGFDPVKREAAITALMELRKQDRITVLTDAINKLDTRGATAQPAVLELGRLLLAVGPALKSQRPLLFTMSRNAISQGFTREVAYAAVSMADGAPDEIWKATDDDVATRTMLLNAIPLIPDPALRASFQPRISALLADARIHPNIRRAALKSLPALGAQHAAASFVLLAAHLKHGTPSPVAVSSLLQLPKDSWDKNEVPALAKLLLKQCSEIPADRRTNDDFIDAQQLGIDLASLMPDGEALKRQFKELGVATVLLKTLREQMIYDKLSFEVEAGKPVAIVLENTDIMPHNIVIVQPGALEEVATKAQTMPPVPDKAGRLYIPESDKILAASKMLEPGQREKLTWTAPKKPGKVPFLCTFPGHWVRMKGEIVVK